jgi:hypothetical protein
MGSPRRREAVEALTILFRSEEAMRAWIGQHPQFNGREARVLGDFLTSTLR